MIQLSQPKIVAQSHDRLDCWAAATESYLYSRPCRMNYTKGQIVDGMREEGVLDAKDGLRRKSGQPLWELFYGLRPIVESIKQFSVAKCVARLKIEYRPIMLGMTGGEDIGHVVLMWGANAEAEKIAVMDPWYPNSQRIWTQAELRAKTGNIVSWMGKLPLLT